MMLAVLLFAAIQAAPAAPAAANPEAALRTALAARGMSKAGIDTMIAVQKRHAPAIRAIIQRGQQAELAMRAALAKRPVDVDAFATATNARAEATAALSREGAAISIEQMRAASPADRMVVAAPPAK